VSSDFTFIESVAGYSFETFQEKFFPNGLDDAQAVDTVSLTTFANAVFTHYIFRMMLILLPW
jgi:hypothetical protein